MSTELLIDVFILVASIAGMVLLSREFVDWRLKK